MKSKVILIDHREWKEWRDESEYGALGKLNLILGEFGVALEVLNGHDCDFLEIRAVSTDPSALSALPIDQSRLLK